jgi:hypothetical protein
MPSIALARLVTESDSSSSLEPHTLKPGNKTQIEMNFNEEAMKDAGGKGPVEREVGAFQTIGERRIRDTHCEVCKRTNSDAKNIDNEGFFMTEPNLEPLNCEERSGEQESLHLYKRTPSAW